SVITIWYTIGTLIIPALLIAVVSSYFEKLQIHSNYIFLAMLLSFSTSFVLFLFGLYYKTGNQPALFLGLEPIYPGLAIGLLIYLFGYSRRKFLKVESEF
ncbi:MAG: hypothetical protein LH629_05300, partial [Ignavibacteria bacterium]|nr:hypothetical protein [Ignavibacteria bacterium]